jgi:hypothetical protein
MPSRSCQWTRTCTAVEDAPGNRYARRTQEPLTRAIHADTGAVTGQRGAGQERATGPVVGMTLGGHAHRPRRQPLPDWVDALPID